MEASVNVPYSTIEFPAADSMSNAHFAITDINECDDSASCHSDARCENTIGSFNCTCKEGFTGNGMECQGK